MGMPSNAQIEQLMQKFFPTCPLCESQKGYSVGWAKNTVECKECHAKWFSDDFEKCEDLVKLRLKYPSKDGKGNTLLYKNKSVGFWKNYHQIQQTEKEIRELETTPEKIEKIEEMRCPLCGKLMLNSVVTLRIGGWSGKANVVSDLLISPLVTKIGQVQEELLPVIIYYCIKCGKMEFIATHATRQRLLKERYSISLE